MRKNIHPNYQDVLFIDSTTDYKFVCGSTLQPKERATFNGVEYPVYRLSTSSSSHPFFTGSNKLVDAEGRVDRFKNRYAAAQQKTQSIAEEKNNTEENLKEKKKEKKTTAKKK